MDGYECPACGLLVGSHQVHSDDVCRRQREVNRRNLGTKCIWCGVAGIENHKQSCPRSLDGD